MLQAESDSGYAATDWGICLSAPSEEGSYKYAAFRAHYFQVVPAMEATNVLKCHILRVIEDTFPQWYCFVMVIGQGNMRQRC